MQQVLDSIIHMVVAEMLLVALAVVPGEENTVEDMDIEATNNHPRPDGFF